MSDRAVKKLNQVQGCLRWAVGHAEMHGNRRLGRWLARKLHEHGVSILDAEQKMRVYQQSIRGDGYGWADALASLYVAYAVRP